MSGDSRLVWSSGVGGAQCEDCDEFTIVRDFGEDDICVGITHRWLCRECREGIDDETFWDESDSPAASSSSSRTQEEQK